MPYAKLLWIAIAAYVAMRGVLFYAAHAGSSSAELRARVEKHWTAVDIERGREYAHRGFALRVLRAALHLAVLLVFLQSGLAGWLADAAGRWGGGRWPLQVATFTSILVVGFFVLDLPFGYYLGHVLEQRFEFSNQTAAGWLWVQAKNLAVLVVFAVLAALAGYGLLRVAPRAWVVVVPAAFAVLQALLVLVVPLVLLPLYYRSTPLEAGPFRDRVVEVLSRAGIAARDVFVIDESRYSNHTNAFFTGLGPTKNIYLFDTLLRDHPEGEGLAVVGHEAGHWRGAHVLKGLVLGTAALFAGALLLSWLYPRLAAGAGWRPLADPGSLPAVLLLALLGSFFASPLECLVSRAFEREADRAALELTGDRASCVETERRLARTNRSNLLPHPLVVWWYYSHPPPLERIEMAGGG